MLPVLAVCPLDVAAGNKLDADLSRLLDWLPGEYDNYEQVWQEKIDEVQHPHEHLHHIFVPVASPRVGDNIFFVQQYLDADPDNVYRQRLYRFSVDDRENAIRLTIYSFKDEARFRDAHLAPESLAEIGTEDLATIPGCEVYWRFEEDHFVGYMKQRACNFLSERSGKRIFVTDDLKLTPDEIWIRDEGFDMDGNRIFGHADRIHHKNRKVRYYTGWGIVKAKGRDAAADDDDWFALRGVVMHNEGQIVSIPNDEGDPSGYSFQLERVTYQETRIAVLKLGLIDDSTGYTFSYTWADPGADRIGINLRWIQVGLTLKTEDRAFGFTPTL